MSVFIDTGVFVAYVNKSDEHHGDATSLLEGIMKDEYGAPFTSDYIFDEVVTVALRRTKRLAKASEAGTLILGDEKKKILRFVSILQVTRDVFNDAWNLFHEYPEKRLSFTDCTSISLMHKRSIDYIASFDAGFDGIVVRLKM